jgi:Transposase, Mutator family
MQTGASQPLSLNPTGTQSRRHTAHFVSAIDIAKDGLLDDLKKALSERIPNAELDEHPDGERGDGVGNRRNGTSKKTVLTGTSKLTIAVPRDREGSFDPKLIAKYQRRFPDVACPRAGEAGPGGSQDRLDVCQGAFGARDPWTSRGDLRH